MLPWDVIKFPTVDGNDDSLIANRPVFCFFIPRDEATTIGESWHLKSDQEPC